MDVCRIQAMLAWYWSCLFFILVEWMPVRNGHSFIINSVVLDKSTKFHYCSRKLNMHVLARETEILSDHLLALVCLL